TADFAAIVKQLEKTLRSGRLKLDWRGALDDLAKNEGLGLEAAWALMLSWLADKLSPELSISRQALRLLRRTLSAFDESRRQALRAIIDSRFPGFDEERRIQATAT
ncbi:MAG: hypothetical protein LBP33_07590, partial [Candidatus Adiutrix sp.]|nr:hypothetical protein [Candidatus Adiutrix sp.]